MKAAQKVPPPNFWSDFKFAEANEKWSCSSCVEIWKPRDLTLADAVALEPGAWGIPDKLLPVFLNGYVKGVTNIWVVEVSHTQDLWE